VLDGYRFVRDSSRWVVAGVVFAGITTAFGALRAHVDRPTATADIVFVNGRVFTADSTRPWAEAVAVLGDRIMAVGRTAEMLELAGPRTRQVDLAGRLVVPGLDDAHDHVGAPLPGVAFATTDEPVPDPSLRVVLDSLSSVSRRVAAGTWIRTDIDATILDDPRARRDALDSVTPRHPVMLTASTGHGVVLNSAALRALRLRDDEPDPVGGFYERDGAPYPGMAARGRITGLLHEYAGWNARRALGSAQPDSVIVAGFRRHAARALAFGITSVQDMANAVDAATTLRVLERARLPIRVRVVPMPGTDSTRRLTAEWRDASRRFAGRPWTSSAPRPTVSGLKWILDGTGIERLSLLRKPFADRPGWHGMANFPADTLRTMLREALSSGTQPVLHAIGDSTLALTLSAIESVAADTAWRRVRPRFEHAEWLTPDLRERARRFGVIVVENPTHFTDGPERMRARFGERRGRDYQPLGSLPASGIPIAIGSDGPLNPFLNIELATEHPDNPAEAITREQAVMAYTRGSAYAERAEGEKGTLAPGMLADLAVLSRDIFTIPANDLPSTVSLLTLVGGRVAYDAGVLAISSRAGRSAERPTRPPR